MRGSALVWLTLGMVAPMHDLVAQGASGGEVAPIAPRFAGGTVWVMPLPFSPRELARRLTGGSRQESLDSTVKAVTRAYMDALAVERARRGEGQAPTWTTQLGGTTVGLDSRYLYLGPVKLPAFLLALLPIHFPQVNPQAWDLQRIRGRMLEDIATAGARQAVRAEVADGVKAMRAEREAARAFAANQRRPPPIIQDP